MVYKGCRKSVEEGAKEGCKKSGAKRRVQKGGVQKEVCKKV